MSRDGIEGADNFFEFVKGQGPFELTAIALSAGAGLRLGMGLFHTKGLSRVDSVREAGRQSIPVMAASAVLFILKKPFVNSQLVSVEEFRAMTLLAGLPRRTQAVYRSDNRGRIGACGNGQQLPCACGFVGYPLPAVVWQAGSLQRPRDQRGQLARDAAAQHVG